MAETAKPARKAAVRLTAAQRREKAAASVSDNIAKAATLLINVADGCMASGDRQRAKDALDLWSALVSLDDDGSDQPPAANALS